MNTSGTITDRRAVLAKMIADTELHILAIESEIADLEMQREDAEWELAGFENELEELEEQSHDLSGEWDTSATMTPAQRMAAGQLPLIGGLV